MNEAISYDSINGRLQMGNWDYKPKRRKNLVTPSCAISSVSSKMRKFSTEGVSKLIKSRVWLRKRSTSTAMSLPLPLQWPFGSQIS